jgi:hypothetical protein
MKKSKLMQPFLPFMLLATLLCAQQSIAQTQNTFRSAFVGAGNQSGQAILFTHGNECFAITPAHVIDKAGGDLFDVEVQGSGGLRAKGIYKEIYRFDSAVDLSLGSVNGSITTECGGQFGAIDLDVANTLEKSTEGSIHIMDSKGELTRMRALVESTDFQFVFLSPNSQSKQIIKGMSGSLIAINNNAVGMLLTGEGKALRMDRISELVKPYLNSSEKSKAVVKKNELNKVQNWLKVQLSHWTGESIAPATSVQNLIDYRSTNESSQYLIKRPDRPAEVVFSLPQGTQLGRVQIMGYSLKNSPKLLKSVEIMVDPIGSGRWRSVSHGDVSLTDGSLELTFQPAEAKSVMIRLYNNWGHAAELGFDKVYLYSK